MREVAGVVEPRGRRQVAREEPRQARPAEPAGLDPPVEAELFGQRGERWLRDDLALTSAGALEVLGELVDGGVGIIGEGHRRDIARAVIAREPGKAGRRIQSA